MSKQNSEQLDAANVLRVLDVSRQLAAPLDLDELLTLVIDVGREVLGADRGTVFLYDEQRRELFSQVATGEKELRLSVDTGSIAGDCVQFTACVSSVDCVDADATPVCNTAIGECAACVTDNDCGDSQHCVDTTCTRACNISSSKGLVR